jgi:DNA-binding CsgD family transcriptional regulator
VRPEAAQRWHHLTDREREVLVRVSAAVSNDEIAEQLTLSTAEVKTHVSRCMSKLACAIGRSWCAGLRDWTCQPGQGRRHPAVVVGPAST